MQVTFMCHKKDGSEKLKLAKRDRAEYGINFKNRNREIHDWKNEEYTIDEETIVQEVAPYPEKAAEFPGIEIERE